MNVGPPSLSASGPTRIVVVVDDDGGGGVDRRPISDPMFRCPFLPPDGAGCLSRVVLKAALFLGATAAALAKGREGVFAPGCFHPRLWARLRGKSSGLLLAAALLDISVLEIWVGWGMGGGDRRRLW